ncbi:MAG: heme-binding protein [Deltaproteobacteria bacterium]|nr:heme-binding protein [Deltaproteobacteria bacterium]
MRLHRRECRPDRRRRRPDPRERDHRSARQRHHRRHDLRQRPPEQRARRLRHRRVDDRLLPDHVDGRSRLGGRDALRGLRRDAEHELRPPARPRRHARDRPRRRLHPERLCGDQQGRYRQLLLDPGQRFHDADREHADPAELRPRRDRSPGRPALRRPDRPARLQRHQHAPERRPGHRHDPRAEPERPDRSAPPAGRLRRGSRRRPALQGRHPRARGRAPDRSHGQGRGRRRRHRVQPHLRPRQECPEQRSQPRGADRRRRDPGLRGRHRASGATHHRRRPRAALHRRRPAPKPPDRRPDADRGQSCEHGCHPGLPRRHQRRDRRLRQRRVLLPLRRAAPGSPPARSGVGCRLGDAARPGRSGSPGPRERERRDPRRSQRHPALPGDRRVESNVGAGGLSADDVQELLVNSLLLAERTRAQTRTPLGGQARIDVAVVDLDGNVLGFARSQDALLDGIDVTIAKTRQAAFFSKNDARTQLEDAFDPLGNAGAPGARPLNVRPLDDFVDTAATFLGFPAPVLATDPPFNGDFAWSSIALGAISNPDFPPGVLDAGEGPLSRREGEWSIFSTGLQTEVVLPGIALGLCDTVPDLANQLDALGLVAPPALDVFRVDAAGNASRRAFCQNLRNFLIGSTDPGRQLDCLQGVQDFPVGAITGLQNGFHIFQGAVPIYRGNTLVGAIGVSGDGAEQDDFVPFVALDEVGKDQQRRGVPTPIGNAPGTIRANRISVQNVNLRYVVCPTAPFLTSNEQNGCEGR